MHRDMICYSITFTIQSMRDVLIFLIKQPWFARVLLTTIRLMPCATGNLTIAYEYSFQPI